MSIATCRGHVKVLDVLDGSPRRSELLKEIAALLKSHREDDARRWSGKCRKTEKSGKANPAKTICWFWGWTIK